MTVSFIKDIVTKTITKRRFGYEYDLYETSALHLEDFTGIRWSHANTHSTLTDLMDSSPGSDLGDWGLNLSARLPPYAAIDPEQTAVMQTPSSEFFELQQIRDDLDRPWHQHNKFLRTPVEARNRQRARRRRGDLQNPHV